MPFYFATRSEAEAQARRSESQSDSTSIQPNGSSDAQGSRGNNHNRNSSDNSPSCLPAIPLPRIVPGPESISSHDSAHATTMTPAQPEPETVIEEEERTKELIHLHTTPGAVNSLPSLSRYLTLLLKFHEEQRSCLNSKGADLDPFKPQSGELNIYLSPLVENAFISFNKLIAEGPYYTEEDVPLIMSDIASIWIPEGSKWASSIRKLQEMQIEWFDLRFGEYFGFNGLSAESYARRENLGRLTGRKDAIFVDSLWASPQPKPQQWDWGSQSTEDANTTRIQFTQALFDRSSWETILSILEREEIDKNLVPFRIVKQEGPMTTLIRILAGHTNDTFPNVQHVISDYVARRRPSQWQYQLSLKSLLLRKQYFDLAGRLAADLTMAAHLPEAIDKGWKPLLVDKLDRIIQAYFKQFDMDKVTGAILTYSPRLPGEGRKRPGPYWRRQPPPKPTTEQSPIPAEEEIDARTGRSHEPSVPPVPPSVWQTRGSPNISGQLSTGRSILPQNGYTTRDGRLQSAWPALGRQPTPLSQASAWPPLGSQPPKPQELLKGKNPRAGEKRGSPNR